jgi:hypothetical protein
VFEAAYTRRAMPEAHLHVRGSVTRLHDHIMEAAREFAAMESTPGVHQPGHQAAVVLAQMACEVASARGIAALCEHRRVGAPPSREFDYTLRRKTSQSFWKLLTGHPVPTHGGWWSKYRAHVERRNAVIHRGRLVTAREAAASIRAAESFIAFVTKALEAEGLPHLTSGPVDLEDGKRPDP